MMSELNLIYLATIAFSKKYDYETMKYSDYLYGETDRIDDVWEYVEELEEIGTIAFKKKYKGKKMYI